jgi:hypothetical protein
MCVRLLQLLTRDLKPLQRPTATEALQHKVGFRFLAPHKLNEAQWITSGREAAKKPVKYAPADLRHKGASTLRRIPSIGPEQAGRRLTTEAVEGILNDMERNPETNEAGKLIVQRQAELQTRMSMRGIAI